MTISQTDRRDAWTTILVFMGILTGLSAIAHFALLELNPTSLYVGALMLCPAIAALATQKIRGRNLSSLPWAWGNWRGNIQAYLIPVAYVGFAYALIWVFGLGAPFNRETIADWSAELGFPTDVPTLSMLVMIALLASVQFVKSLGSIAGEEIGWRGFLVWELRKVMPFGAVSIVSGLIWAAWHFPIVIKYGGGDPLFQLACFTLMITSMSVIMTYYTFRSASLWPAVMFHGAHNIVIQKVFTPLTVESESTGMWIDEYGLMVPLVVTLFAVFYWRKAKAEGF
ncbi:type II CAAX endopeptidase family protein [Henriciella sp.]|uniref:CPBP family intramembrane glutamic endopeptidase n=1 Tax=Henriciella sp. TaxID=1968823 RepID=UPI00261C8F16|nr:type II CAAX endopeptidase family protein [Henriciella sp.]